MKLLQWLARSPTLAAVLLVAGIACLFQVDSGRAQVWKWSQTFATNATVDSSINWAEGMSPSGVNDSARAMMGQLSKWRDDLNGTVTTGGTSTAYTVTTNQVLTVLTSGHRICFAPNATNGATVTIAVDGLAAKPLRSAPNVELGAGVLVSGTPYCATYFTTNSGEYIVESFYGNPYNVPLGAMLDYTGATAPNSNFVLPAGQAISRTTYAPYFAIVSTTYGTGDGVTTFNVPDMRGRIVAALDNLNGSAASRLTNSANGCGVAFTTLGATCGNESQTLTTAQTPAHNHGVTDPGHLHSGGQATGQNSNPQNASGGSGWYSTSLNTGTATTGISITNTGGGTAHPIVPPLIGLAKILRIF